MFGEPRLDDWWHVADDPRQFRPGTSAESQNNPRISELVTKPLPCSICHSVTCYSPGVETHTGNQSGSFGSTAEGRMIPSWVQEAAVHSLVL